MKLSRKERGYTIVELMMSLVVLAIGTSGVIAMQKITLRSNSHAKNLAVATRIASAWADALATDASMWNSANDLGQTAWLNLAASNELKWVRPAFNADMSFGAGFGPLGNPLADTQSALARYCTDLRFTWLAGNPAAGSQSGNGLIRAEIRVFWKRDSAVTVSNLPANLCDPGTNGPTNLSSADHADGYHIVYLTTGIAQTGTGS